MWPLGEVDSRGTKGETISTTPTLFGSFQPMVAQWLRSWWTWNPSRAGLGDAGNKSKKLSGPERIMIGWEKLVSGSIHWIGTCLRSTARAVLGFLFYYLLFIFVYYPHLVILFYPFVRASTSTSIRMSKLDSSPICKISPCKKKKWRVIFFPMQGIYSDR